MIRLRAYLDQEAQNQARAARLVEEVTGEEHQDVDEMEQDGEAANIGAPLTLQSANTALHPPIMFAQHQQQALPPPPPVHHNLQHNLQLHQAQGQTPLPPLYVPAQQIGEAGANGSPTNDAPLTLDDGDEEFGMGSEMLDAEQ